jgi:hypothetical protein
MPAGCNTSPLRRNGGWPRVYDNANESLVTTHGKVKMDVCIEEMETCM